MGAGFLVFLDAPQLLFLGLKTATFLIRTPVDTRLKGDALVAVGLFFFFWGWNRRTDCSTAIHSPVRFNATII